MPRQLDLRPDGRARHGSGAPSVRMLTSAVLLQLLAALLVLLVAPGTAASPGPLRPAVLPATASGSPTGPSTTPTEGGAPPLLPAAPAAGGRSAGPAPDPSPLEVAGPAAPTSPPAPLPLPWPRAAAGPLPVAPEDDPARREQARTDAVRELLAVRAEAVLTRDEAAFLSVVDPAAPALRSRQEALFAALAAVPLSTWEYSLDPTVQQAPDSRLDRTYGVGRWWAPGVELRTALAGVDDRPTATVQHLTFVERDGRWLLAADDDFAGVGMTTRRALWDSGPVVAERVDDVLVLGRPDDRELLREVAATTAAAVPRVSAAWGADWQQAVVVLVPGSGGELAELIGSDDDLSQIAGLATAELGDPELGQGPTGERMLLNPDVFPGLSPSGRRLVLTHELTHVATRRATGPATPTWLAEGYADHVGYSGMSLPLSATAPLLRAEVRDGRLPDRLPVEADFGPASPGLAQAYEQAWLLVRVIAEQHGEDGLLRFYRAVGREQGADPAAAVERALRSELGSSTEQLVADWRAALQRDLG